MQNEVLTNSNFLLYCAKHYDSSLCATTEEFYEDVKRIKYIKKLLTRYTKTGELKERLILNHIIILNNVFGAHHTPRILFLKMQDQLKYLKPFLLTLGICPKVVVDIGCEECHFFTEDIPCDDGIMEALRKL